MGTRHQRYACFGGGQLRATLFAKRRGSRSWAVEAEPLRRLGGWVPGGATLAADDVALAMLLDEERADGGAAGAAGAGLGQVFGVQ